MSNGYVQVAPDSTGKKLQTFENTVPSNTVEAQAAVLVDSTGTPLSANLPTIATTLAVLKGNNDGTAVAATEGTDYYKPGATDVAIADGGTGASTAAAARQNIMAFAVSTVTSNTTLSAPSWQIILGDTSGGAVTTTLPTAASNT